MTDSHDLDPDDVPDDQGQIYANETPINGEMLTEGRLYTVTVDIDSLRTYDGGINLKFSDANDNPRSVSLLEWKTSLQRDQFQAGTKVTLTHVEYSYNEPYHNLEATEETSVIAVSRLEPGDQADGGEDGSKSEYDEAAAVSDALADVDDAAASNDTGHALTSYQSTATLDPVTVYEYTIQLEHGTNPSHEDRRSITYDVTTHLGKTEGHLVARNGELTFVTVEPVDTLATDDIDDVAGIAPADPPERVLDPATDSQRETLTRLLEEAFKARARSAGYTVHSINKILGPEPIDLDVHSNKFSLYDRWDCTLDLSPAGQLYVHVDAKTKVVSNLTLDEINPSNLYPGLRLQTTYGNRKGYYFQEFLSEGADDHELNPDQTVVDYHRTNPAVDDETVATIKQHNRPAVSTFGMGKTGQATFPQELLAVQGHTENLSTFAPQFYEEARNEWYRTPQDRVEDAHKFIQTIDRVAIGNQTVSLNTTSAVFDGDDRFDIRELYGPREDILTFGDGQTADHPNNTGDLPVYEAPDSFDVAFIYPENFAGDRADTIWQHIADKASTLGAEPTRIIDIDYEPVKKGERTSHTASHVGAEVGRDSTPSIDAALCVLPPDDDDFFNYAIPYNDLKEVLGEQHINSQMVHSDTIKQRFTHTNIALGLIAAAGGIPYTIEDALPGDADLVIGLDVGESFDDTVSSEDSPTAGIRVGASTTAIYRDGTILGHTNTGAQTGERIPARELMKIVRGVVIGYRQRFDETPNHIVIHRDGFMNDPLGKVLEYLNDEGISYDIVEVRKQAPMRIVDADGYGYSVPDKGIATIDRQQDRAYLATFGDPEDLARNGTPRPITVERVDGPTDITTLARQVYLLSQCHIGVSNTTVRVPISTSFADRAATAAANGYLPKATELETGIGYI